MKPVSNPVSFEFNGETYTWGDKKNWVLFAGPDLAEDEGMVMETAKELKKITKEYRVPWIFKCSFDKANRTSSKSFRGFGVDKGLAILEKVKTELNVPILTDIHESQQVEAVAAVADVIQIPAFLCRQTDLVVAVAKSGKVMNIKKGQFLAPWDMESVVKKAEEAGNSKLLLCERGTTFGYNRLVNDMLGLVDMREIGYPIVMDASHSTQLPGGKGSSSDGRGHLIPTIARAAMAVGVDGVFMETHPDPKNAKCDGPSSLDLKEMPKTLEQLNYVWRMHQS